MLENRFSFRQASGIGVGESASQSEKLLGGNRCQVAVFHRRIGCLNQGLDSGHRLRIFDDACAYFVRQLNGQCHFAFLPALYRRSSNELTFREVS